MLTVILLGTLARIGSALYQGNTLQPLPGVTDQISYHALAVRVLQGHGFSFGTGWWPATAANEPTAHWSYLYVLFLVAVYSLFGADPLAARLIQAILVGILQPLITWRIGKRLFGPRVGLVSAALTSFYAYFVFYAGALVTESLFIVATLGILDIGLVLAAPAHHGRGAPRLRLWVALGIAFAIAALLRQVMLPLLPLILAWIGWQLLRQQTAENESSVKVVRSLLGRMAMSTATLLICILPWTIRNYIAFGQFVLLNTNAGYAFFAGNHPIHGVQFIPILPGPGSNYAALLPAGLHHMNEAALEKELFHRGVTFVREDPARYILLSMSRAKEYFKFWPSPDSSGMSNCVRVLSFGLCLPFLLCGLFIVVSRRKEFNGQTRAGATLLILLAGSYSLAHLLTWALVRYRLPVDAMTSPFVALSIVLAYDRVTEAIHVAPLKTRSVNFDPR